MGATVSLLVAARRPELVRGLMLADPVLMKKSIYRTYNTPLLNLTIGRNAAFDIALRPIVRFSNGVL
jgi:pimeloyl-ACP methyl ester carboxylesterase